MTTYTLANRLESKARWLGRTMIRLDELTDRARAHDNTRDASELWCRRDTAREYRSALLRQLWALRRKRYETPTDANL